MKLGLGRISRRAVFYLLTPILLSGGIVKAKEAKNNSSNEIKITSKNSLVHLGSIDSFDITEGGIEGAKFLLEALENDNKDAATAAYDTYDALIPQENFGGEYTALQWFCEYLLASDYDRNKFLGDQFISAFFDFFAANNFANLKEYLKRKYELEELPDNGTTEAEKRKAFLEDFILFNNPRRERWEKTSKIIEVLQLKSGDRLADIGSGPGYYTFKFAQLVGETGKVLAIDTVEEHLNYTKEISKKSNLNNIEFINNKSDSIAVAENQVDIAFMCSLYHVIYTTSIEKVKDKFVESIKTALKPDGRLVIVDNALVEDQELPYHGPYIAKELIIGQLKYYGFTLVEQHQFIPQRYVLIFKMES